MITPRALIDQSEITRAINRATQVLAPDVIYVRYDLAYDSTGEPAIYFRVLLSDRASRAKNLFAKSLTIEKTIPDEINPLERRLQPYFSFRSESEQRELKEKAWAQVCRTLMICWNRLSIWLGVNQNGLSKRA